MNPLFRLIPRFLCVTCVLLATTCLVGEPQAVARDHHDGHLSSSSKSIFKHYSHARHDKGHEATGQAAAWLFGVANVAVAISLLSKGAVRYAPMSEQSRERIKRLNQKQKKYLMPLHYLLNPVALATALTHFLMSRCPSTALPEWSLVLMSGLIGVGLLVKFRMLPVSLRKRFYLIHTSPLPFAALLSLLLIGHSIVD